MCYMPSRTPWVDAAAQQIRLARTDKGCRTRVSQRDKTIAILSFWNYYNHRKALGLPISEELEIEAKTHNSKESGNS